MYIKKKIDVRFKKRQLNKSMDYNTCDIQKNIFLEKKITIQTIPNKNKNNSIIKNDNLDQLKLEIKDLEKKIEEKDKIIEKLQENIKKYYNKNQKYKDKIKKLESNELQYLKNIIKFDKNKLIIGQNINFILLSNKKEENKKKDLEKIKNVEIDKLKNEIKSQNKKIGEIEGIIKKNNEELTKLRNENKSINEELSRIKEENNNSKEHIKILNLKDMGNIKLVKEKSKKNNCNRSSSMPKMESKFSNEPIKLYEYPTLIGLNNREEVCFMNSILQCLSQTEALSNYFLKEKNLYRINNNNLAKSNICSQLSPIYLELIKKSKDKIVSFSPNDFMNTIKKMNPLFKAGQSGNAKDFIIFILKQLHEELKQPITSCNNNMNPIQPPNKYDRNNTLHYFINEFQKGCSIISDIFFGFNETTDISFIAKIILIQMV